MEHKIEDIIVGILAIIAIIVMAACIAAIFVPTGDTKVNKYDSQCLTEPKSRPLEECREAL